MPNPYFNFKQFTVWHDKCAMKVGTDGVLLGAWTTIPLADKTIIKQDKLTATHPENKLDHDNSRNNHHFSVLDIGTGTGLIAMMIAQRNTFAEIDAIDIDKSAYEQAIDNVYKSPFRNRIKVILQSFVNYPTEKKYDLIVSNPPFFKNSLKCPDEKRSMARHYDSLPLKQLIEHAMTMLSENGRLALILPMLLSEELDFIIATHKLYAIRRTNVIPVEGTQPKRLLIEISMKNVPEQGVRTDTLILETKDRKRTEQYKKLTNDFYL